MYCCNSPRFSEIMRHFHIEGGRIFCSICKYPEYLLILRILACRYCQRSGIDFFCMLDAGTVMLVTIQNVEIQCIPNLKLWLGDSSPPSLSLKLCTLDDV